MRIPEKSFHQNFISSPPTTEHPGLAARELISRAELHDLEAPPGVQHGHVGGAGHEGRLAKGGADRARGADRDPVRRAAAGPSAP